MHFDPAVSTIVCGLVGFITAMVALFNLDMARSSFTADENRPRYKRNALILGIIAAAFGGPVLVRCWIAMIVA